MSRNACALAAVLAITSGAAAAAAHLYPDTVAAWNVYISATEARISRELTSTGRFLALDFAADAAMARRAVLSGEVVVEPMETKGPQGQPIGIPSAAVHHWRGAVWIP